MTKTLKISDLLGQKIEEIKSGSEIIFLYELYKYCKALLNKELDFEDIKLMDRLKISPYYSYVYLKGLNFNFIPKNNEIAEIGDTARLFFEYDLMGIVFEEKSKTKWVYDYNTDRDANLILNQFNRSAGYVSLYAYLVVYSYKKKEKQPLLLLKNTSTKQEEYEYVDILILSNFGNKLLENKVKVQFSKDVVNQPEWEAYIFYHRQLGYMITEVPIGEKIRYMQEHFQVGDVALYYKTEKPVKSKTIRRLVSCYPCVIRSITKTAVEIDFYPDITTLLTKKRQLQEAEEFFENEYTFSYEDYNRFPISNVNLDYFTFGVDKLFFAEEEYLLTPQDGTDTFEQYIIDKNGVEGVYKMGTLDTIYTVFEDRKVKYDKKAFVSKYFKDREPMYLSIVGKK